MVSRSSSGSPVSSRARNGGTGMSQVTEWKPVFPEPQPAHWLALVNTSDHVRVVSDVTLSGIERDWLAGWLSHYGVAEPDVPATYVYLGLSADWMESSPDGRTSPFGVTGVGSGEGFGEPPGSVSSTTGDIIEQSIEALRS